MITTKSTPVVWDEGGYIYVSIGEETAKLTERQADNLRWLLSMALKCAKEGRMGDWRTEADYDKPQ
jgi:hypothetical protein